MDTQQAEMEKRKEFSRAINRNIADMIDHMLDAHIKHGFLEEQGLPPDFFTKTANYIVIQDFRALTKRLREMEY